MLDWRLSALVVGFAGVGLVFGNDPACPEPGRLYAQCIDLDEVTSPWQSDARLGACADNFTLPAGGDIYRIRWWGLYAHLENCSPWEDDFQLSFWSDDEGKPGPPTVPLPSGYAVTRSTEPVGEFTSGLTPLQVYEYELTFEGSPFVAASNVTYWLEIYNDAGGEPTNCPWHWVGAPDPPGDGVFCYRSGFSEPAEWNTLIENDRSFALLRTPPIPVVADWGMAVLTLVVLSAGTVVLMRRRPVQAWPGPVRS